MVEHISFFVINSEYLEAVHPCTYPVSKEETD